MIQGYWGKVRSEWRANSRLRVAAMVVIAFTALHLLLAMEDRRQALATRYTSDLELQARMEGLRGGEAWFERARQAESALQELQARVPEVNGPGLAKAELQAWLTQLAAIHSLSNSSVRIEEALEVEGQPDLWKVLGRLEGVLPAYGEGAFLRALSEAMPWIQVERIEIHDGSSPSRVTLVVRAYYRRGVAGAVNQSSGQALPASVGNAGEEKQ